MCGPRCAAQVGARTAHEFRQTVFMVAVARFTTADSSEECLGQIRRLFFTAFDETFSEQDWEHVLGDWHVVVSDGGVVIA